MSLLLTMWWYCSMCSDSDMYYVGILAHCSSGCRFKSQPNL